MTDHCLVLTQEQLAAIQSHVIADRWRESCGLLGGAGGRVERIYPIRNVSTSPDASFVMDPGEQIRAMLEIDALGWEIVGIYHSHPPGSRTDPSLSDVALAAYPEAIHLIIVPGYNGQNCSARAFRISGGLVAEVELMLENSAPI